MHSVRPSFQFVLICHYSIALEYVSNNHCENVSQVVQEFRTLYELLPPEDIEDNINYTVTLCIKDTENLGYGMEAYE